MERAQLKFLLHSGPSRIFDIRKLQLDGELEPLFKIGSLNGAILIKQSSKGEVGADNDELPSIATKIYLPYDRRRPEDGGESFFFTKENLRGAFAANSGDKSVGASEIAADTELLTLFNKVPSFSPYLISDILERANITIPKGYLTMPERETAMIKQRMQARLRPLIATAYGTSDAISDASIERLVQKLWELTDLQELAPLIQAFRITVSEAPEVFYCWLGIAFFENEYIKLQPRLKKMAEWMSTGATPREALPREVLDYYKLTVATTRKNLQQNWKTALTVLQEYSATYEELVGASGSAKRFIDFLRPSKTHFWSLGGCLGRLEQSVEIWHHVNSRNDFRPLNFDRSSELFTILNIINKPDTSSPGEPKFAASAVAN